MPINKSEKGKKRFCGNCSSKFYDLSKQPPLICPVCKSEVEIEIFNIQQNLTSGLSFSQKKENIKENNKIENEDFDTAENDADIETNENQQIVSLEEIDEEN